MELYHFAAFDKKTLTAGSGGTLRCARTLCFHLVKPRLHLCTALAEQRRPSVRKLPDATKAYNLIVKQSLHLGLVQASIWRTHVSGATASPRSLQGSPRHKITRF